MPDAALSAAAQPAEGLGTQGSASQQAEEPAKEVREHDCAAQSVAGDTSGSQRSTLQPLPASAEAPLPETKPAPDEPAAHAAASDAAVAVVEAIADPAALVDFPFNTRRGEPPAGTLHLKHVAAHCFRPLPVHPSQVPVRVLGCNHRAVRRQPGASER